MNETKKAIEHFHYGITHDIFSEPVKTYARLAVDALREKQEREKGCEYCKTPFKTMLKFYLGIYGNGDTAELYVETDGQNIRAYDNDPRNPQIESSPIRFCPMCGKSLEGGHQ